MSEDHFAMVSDWMVNGNINEFVKRNPGADRLGLVGFLSIIPPRAELIDDSMDG